MPCLSKHPGVSERAASGWVGPCCHDGRLRGSVSIGVAVPTSVCDPLLRTWWRVIVSEEWRWVLWGNWIRSKTHDSAFPYSLSLPALSPSLSLFSLFFLFVHPSLSFTPRPPFLSHSLLPLSLSSPFSLSASSLTVPSAVSLSLSIHPPPCHRATSLQLIYDCESAGESQPYDCGLWELLFLTVHKIQTNTDCHRVRAFAYICAHLHSHYIVSDVQRLTCNYLRLWRSFGVNWVSMWLTISKLDGKS